MADSRASQQILRGRAREAACLELRKAGLTYAAIGERLGMSESGAWRAVMRALKRLMERINEQAEDVRTLEVQRLDDLLETLWPYRHKPAYVDRILRVMERRARLLGLDAPERREISGGMEIEIGWGDEATPARPTRSTGGDT